jgi:hypothetical protein
MRIEENLWTNYKTTPLRWQMQKCKLASAEAQLFLLESIASWMDQSLEFGLRFDSPDQAR